MNIPDLLVTSLQSNFVKMLIAFVLALPVAYDRERSTHIMGLRTFPLVSIGTCGIVLIGLGFIDPNASDAQARIIQGILAGIGFIGGGAILKKGDRVLGTASAASIWSTGAIGVGVAYGEYGLAIFLAIANFLVLRWLTPLKPEIDSPQVRDGEDI